MLPHSSSLAENIVTASYVLIPSPMDEDADIHSGDLKALRSNAMNVVTIAPAAAPQSAFMARLGTSTAVVFQNIISIRRIAATVTIPAAAPKVMKKKTLN